MLQLDPAYSLCNRHKTLTGSPDPTYMQSTNKPCTTTHRKDTSGGIVCSRGGSRILCRRGHQPSGGAPTYDFVKFSEKLHEIKKILGHRGACARGVPPKSATPQDLKLELKAVLNHNGGCESEGRLHSPLQPLVWPRPHWSRHNSSTRLTDSLSILE